MHTGRQNQPLTKGEEPGEGEDFSQIKSKKKQRVFTAWQGDTHTEQLVQIIHCVTNDQVGTPYHVRSQLNFVERELVQVPVQKVVMPRHAQPAKEDQGLFLHVQLDETLQAHGQTQINWLRKVDDWAHQWVIAFH